MVSHTDPLTPYKMAWQKACQSSSTSAGLQLLSPTSVVSMKMCKIPSSSARSVSSSAPSRTTASGKSVVNFGFATVRDFIYNDEPSEPIHCLQPTFLLKALYHHLDSAVTIFLRVCQELERIDQIVEHSLQCRVRPKNFCFSCCLVWPRPCSGPSNRTGRCCAATARDLCFIFKTLVHKSRAAVMILPVVVSALGCSALHCLESAWVVPV